VEELCRKLRAMALREIILGGKSVYPESFCPRDIIEVCRHTKQRFTSRNDIEDSKLNDLCVIQCLLNAFLGTFFHSHLSGY